MQSSLSPGNGVLLMYTKRLRKSTHTKRPFKSLGCCEGMCHMVLQRAHRKDHGLRSDARIMDHHPSDYGCSSEAGHGRLLSKGTVLARSAMWTYRNMPWVPTNTKRPSKPDPASSLGPPGTTQQRARAMHSCLHEKKPQNKENGRSRIAVSTDSQGQL